MPGQRGRAYRPQMTDELSRYPKRGPNSTKGVESGQKGGPLSVHDLGLAADDWECNSIIEAGSEATEEKKKKNRAAVQAVRDAYFNRKAQGTQ